MRESKEVLKKRQRGKKKRNELCQKDTGTNQKELPMAKAKTLGATKQITIEMDFNPKNKTNIHE